MTELQIHRKKYLLEFAGYFVILEPKYYANTLNIFIRAYLSNYFNALLLMLGNAYDKELCDQVSWINMTTRTRTRRVILAPRAAPPQAASSRKSIKFHLPHYEIP